ncbi:MAG: bifunctional phosphoglucose/phosphomannose isomerase [bacterium]|nr:bifunctional phosphoglucose/phosphomannose isomerase [bacterium]
MMNDAIKNFAKQFKYRPKIQGGKIKKYKKFVIAGMGGSHLAAGILKTIKPELDITIHRDYGLPKIGDLSRPSATLSRPGEGKGRGRTLVIASSYSGNTEETISAFEEAVKFELPIAAIAIGGKLLELAKKYDVPYVQMPDTGIQPRSALGFSLLALLKVMKQNDLLKEVRGLAGILSPLQFEEQGKALAQKLKNKVPVIYASAKNYSLAYNWKIKFNETGKIPAFYNTFPELNHNEMTGFDPVKSREAGLPSAEFNRASLQDKFHIIMLKDSHDHPQIQKRMEVIAKLFQDRGLPVEILELRGGSKLEQIFSSLILADWTAFYTAEGYGLESEQVPMVEEFKRLIV